MKLRHPRQIHRPGHRKRQRGLFPILRRKAQALQQLRLGLQPLRLRLGHGVAVVGPFLEVTGIPLRQSPVLFQGLPIGQEVQPGRLLPKSGRQILIQRIMEGAEHRRCSAGDAASDGVALHQKTFDSTGLQLPGAQNACHPASNHQNFRGRITVQLWKPGNFQSLGPDLLHRGASLLVFLSMPQMQAGICTVCGKLWLPPPEFDTSTQISRIFPRFRFTIMWISPWVCMSFAHSPQGCPQMFTGKSLAQGGDFSPFCYKLLTFRFHFLCTPNLT